ncbi:FtsK/SpoIIIE domain-containing protein [Microbacterium album]|nr:FtsK/SpoIIIE domain-containing protein [Microbacterium album]
MPPALRVDEPVTLPDPVPPPRRAPFPIVASLAPVVASVAIWAVTGSLLALCFAALGPLMAVASLLDAARASRRHRRVALRERAQELDRARDGISRRHETERAARWRERPDVAALLADPRRQWRGATDALVVGRGCVPSAVRVSGGDGDAARELRRQAATLTDAPVTVPLTTGVAVQGEPAIARAVARALLLQLCLARPTEDIVVVAVPDAEREWAGILPHAALDAEGLAARSPRSLRVALVEGTPPPAVDVLLAVVLPGSDVPPGCGALLEVDGSARGRLTWRGESEDGEAEGVSRAQAHAIAEALAARARAMAPPAEHAEGPLALEALLSDRRAEDPAAVARPSLGALGAVIGAEGTAPACVDLVSDGPHAVVVGMTGSGKSELLVTWVVSLAATLPPDRVTFLLADFKGGTAFAPLAGLPHVTGVITDLDGGGARRAVESLRAELRRRERILAAAGARDVSDPGVDVPRLVIVVDEFAAMLQEHPDLHAVFTDVAARGRALGLHLVLGTQRAGGVLRDALVANCPLRIGLRMAEAAESRALLGTDAAAAIPGGPAGRGIAYVRRASDDAARLTRIALSSPADVRAARERFGDRPRPIGPWLPPLPQRLSREELAVLAPEAPSRDILLALADDPARQRRTVVTLRPGADRGIAVVGGGGTGKSTVAATAAAASGALVVPRDPEGAWDALERAERTRPPLVVLDDADALLSRLPAAYAQAAAERLEALVRDAGETGSTIVLTAARLSGALLRVADLLPSRALLALPSRTEHAAAGGDLATFDPRRPPGRAILDGFEVQFVLAQRPAVVGEGQEPPRWTPDAPVSAMVLRAARHRGELLARAWEGRARVTVLDDLRPGASIADVAAPGERVVVVGEGEAWQRQWGLLQEIRGSAPFVVGADCAAELRSLLGERELPPYARPRASRAWLVRDALPPERVLLPG